MLKKYSTKCPKAKGDVFKQQRKQEKQQINVTEKLEHRRVRPFVLKSDLLISFPEILQKM